MEKNEWPTGSYAGPIFETGVQQDPVATALDTAGGCILADLFIRCLRCGPEIIKTPVWVTMAVGR